MKTHKAKSLLTFSFFQITFTILLLNYIQTTSCFCLLGTSLPKQPNLGPSKKPNVRGTSY